MTPCKSFVANSGLTVADESVILERFVKIVPMPSSQVLASVAVMVEDMLE